MRLGMEKNKRSSASPYSNLARTSFKNKTQPIVNFETWRTSRSEMPGSSFRSLSKSLKNIKNFKTLLNSMTQLRKNVNLDSSRKEKESTNRQNSEGELLIKSINMQQHQDQPVCEITVKVGHGTNTYFYRASTSDRLSAFLGERHLGVRRWKVSPSNTALDYYLTIEKSNIEFLNGQSITLEAYKIEKQKKITLDSFDILYCIGTGGFSKVYLCRFKQDGKFYAMKVIDKNFIIKNKKKKIVANQKKIMQKLQHPFIIEMKFAFQSKSSLIFVLEFCPGGQLFGLVKKFKIMNENFARFYMIEILLGLQEIHKNEIIYRDFKPENILIGIDGHIKIADFGLAKPGILKAKERAFSFCGSPEYMPPQMIEKRGHSQPVDFYCLGALLYELVTGLPPFYSEDPQQIFQGTLHQEITFPSYAKLSDDVKQLLKGLLSKDQFTRLGTRNGVAEVLAHPWFRGANRDTYLGKQAASPIKFTGIKDLQLIFEQMRVKNRESISALLAQQKLEELKTFDPIMTNFYYDYRQTNIIQYPERSKKENSHSLPNRYTYRPSINTATSKMRNSSLKNILSQRSFTGNKQNKTRKNKIGTYCLDINMFLR